jgi:hypothetical protein
MSAVLTHPEIEALELGSTIKGKASHIGQADRGAGRVVRHQIFVNVYCGYSLDVGRKDPTVAHAIHEIPLLRRKYGNQGEIIPRASWVSGTPRVHEMTEIDCRNERERLEKSYGEIFADVYGGSHGAKCTLFDAMADAVKAWNAMQGRVSDADRRINDDDIAEVVRAIEPEAASIETIEPIMPSDSTGQAGEADGDLVSFLTRNEVPDDKAQAFAREVKASEGQPLSDEAWSRIPGVGKHEQRRDKLIKLHEQFRNG